jgi:hypothetical protein
VIDVVKAGRDAAALMSCAAFVLVACGVARYKGRFVQFVQCVVPDFVLRPPSHPIYTGTSSDESTLNHLCSVCSPTLALHDPATPASHHQHARRRAHHGGHSRRSGADYGDRTPGPSSPVGAHHPVAPPQLRRPNGRRPWRAVDTAVSCGCRRAAGHAAAMRRETVPRVPDLPRRRPRPQGPPPVPGRQFSDVRGLQRRGRLRQASRALRAGRGVQDGAPARERHGQRVLGGDGGAAARDPRAHEIKEDRHEQLVRVHAVEEAGEVRVRRRLPLVPPRRPPPPQRRRHKQQLQ